MSELTINLREDGQIDVMKGGAVLFTSDAAGVRNFLIGWRRSNAEHAARVAVLLAA